MHAADVFGTVLRQAVEQAVGRGFVPRKEGPAGKAGWNGRTSSFKARE